MSLFDKIFKPKKPIIKENTFLLWEPCSKSHSEVLPGYAKYLLDLGYHVSVLGNPLNFRDGLFARFRHENLSINNLSQKQTKKYLKTQDLSKIKGILTTTIAKLCDGVHYDDVYSAFNSSIDRKKLLFVEHETKFSALEGTWRDDIITLRKMSNVKSIVVNPHYFGEIEKKEKNRTVNFLMVGALRAKRNSANILVSAVEELHKKGISNFKITIVGKGHIKGIDKSIQKYFDLKGRLPFDKMYDEIEQCDFILTTYDDKNPKHQRYNTTGTSGAFQLVYGFLKPCVIIKSFAEINGFDEKNAIFYDEPKNYSKALEDAINMSGEDYKTMQDNLKDYVNALYKTSFENLRNRIEN